MLGVSEARGGLTNLVSVTCGGNLIVASLIGKAAPLRRGKSVEVPYIGSLLAR